MPNTSNYNERGGDRTVIGGALDVASGGALDVKSGGEIDVESGASLKIAGTAITASAAEINQLDALSDPVMFNQYHRVTVAEVNAGHTLLSVPTSKKFRLVDCTLIAIGGNAATATTVDVKCGSSILIAAAAGTLTRSAVVKPNSSNVTVLADGASFTAKTAGDDVTIIKAGDDLETATHIDVILSYVLEDA